MALQKAKRVRGVDLPTAYAVINQIQGSVDSGWAAEVLVYAAKAVKDAGELPIDTFGFSCPAGPGLQHPYTTIYNALKEVGAPFDGAIDV